MIHYFSAKKDIKNFKEDLIKECIVQRKKEKGGFNFNLKTKYINNLYDIFIKSAKKILKPFTLKNSVFVL